MATPKRPSIDLAELTQAVWAANQAAKSAAPGSLERNDWYQVKDLMLSNLIEYRLDHIWLAYQEGPHGDVMLVVTILCRRQLSVHAPVDCLTGAARKRVSEWFEAQDRRMRPGGG